jgi:hypothetical protein
MIEAKCPVASSLILALEASIFDKQNAHELQSIADISVRPPSANQIVCVNIKGQTVRDRSDDGRLFTWD